MAGASANHNLIVLNAGTCLREQLKNKPCQVYPCDLKLRIEATGMYTYPDLSVVCGEPQLESDGGDVLLNPVVLLEVLSDSTEAYDRGPFTTSVTKTPILLFVFLPQLNLTIRKIDLATLHKSIGDLRFSIERVSRCQNERGVFSHFQ